jgi:hypothetical protein
MTSGASPVSAQVPAYLRAAALGISQEHFLRSLDPPVRIGGPGILGVGGPQPEYHRVGGIVDLEDGADMAKGKEREFGRLRQRIGLVESDLPGSMLKTPQLIRSLSTAKPGGLARQGPIKWALGTDFMVGNGFRGRVSQVRILPGPLFHPSAPEARKRVSDPGAPRWFRGRPATGTS